MYYLYMMKMCELMLHKWIGWRCVRRTVDLRDSTVLLQVRLQEDITPINIILILFIIVFIPIPTTQYYVHR